MLEICFYIAVIVNQSLIQLFTTIKPTLDNNKFQCYKFI